MAERFTTDELNAEAVPLRVSTGIYLDRSAWQRHAEAEEELARLAEEDARTNRDPLAYAAAEALRALEAEMEGSRRSFTFGGVGAARWMELVGEHAPSKSQRTDKLDHDPNGFQPAALSASAVDPLIDHPTAVAMYAALDNGQWAELWTAVLRANGQIGTARPKSLLATRILRVRDGSSTTAANGASPAASSLAES